MSTTQYYDKEISRLVDEISRLIAEKVKLKLYNRILLAIRDQARVVCSSEIDTQAAETSLVNRRKLATLDRLIRESLETVPDEEE